MGLNAHEQMLRSEELHIFMDTYSRSDDDSVRMVLFAMFISPFVITVNNAFGGEW
jgi:hypothetical protein